MRFYDMAKAAALAGAEGGGGSGGIDNLLKSEIEVGTIDSDGNNNPNENRLRTKDATTVTKSGNYSLFFTGDESLFVFGFRYAPDGTFIERFGSVGSEWSPAPFKFTAEAGQQFRFAFNSIDGSVALYPADLHNLILVKD